MALNIDKIKQRLASFEKKGKGNSKAKDIIWKPTESSQVVRIVPLQSRPDDPFVHLKFHYDFGGKNYLSPASFNNPDPIVELSERLKKKGNDEKNTALWRQGRDLEPKTRTFVPVIVRGEESKGVRFWGFGVQLYTQLMKLATDTDYGDITSLTEGYDLTVFYKSKEEVKKDYPEITFQPKPKPRPVIDPNDPKAKELLESITTKQPDIYSVYEVASYETLAAALEEYLKKSNEGQQEEEDSDPVPPTEEQIAAATAPAPVAQVTAEVPKVETAPTVTPVSVVSPSAQKAATPQTAQDLTKAFDNLFNS